MCIYNSLCCTPKTNTTLQINYTPKIFFLNLERRDSVTMPVFLGFPCGLAGKEFTCHAGDLGLIPGLEKSPGEGKGYPLQYSDLENSMDCTVHGVAKSWIQLSDFHFHFSLIWLSLTTYRMKSKLLSLSLNTFHNAFLLCYLFSQGLYAPTKLNKCKTLW